MIALGELLSLIPRPPTPQSVYEWLAVVGAVLGAGCIIAHAW